MLAGVLLWTLSVAGGWAAAGFDAEQGVPLLQRFSPEVYQGHYQINDLTVAPDGRVYGTSQRAVVRYDGARWERLDYPALWAWRLAATPDGRVYVGGDDEVGYFVDDATGRPGYHSLVERVPAEARPLGAVRGTKAAGDAVAFAPEKGWLVWQEGAFHFTPAPTAGRTQVHAAGGALYASGTGAGLRRWDGRAWQVFGSAPALATATITGLTAWADGRLLALAAPTALWIVSADGSRADPWTGPGAAALGALRPLGVLALPDGRVAAFTRQSGLILATADGAAITRWEKSHGLPSNTTYGLALDRDGGLWTGGTSGLVRLDLATPASVFDERNGPAPGGIRSLTRQGGVLYAGVVEGVHRLVPADPITGAPARFQPLPGPAGIINDLAPHPEGLLVASTGALHVYRPESGFRPVLQRGEDFEVVWTTPADPARVFLGTEKRLIIGRLDAGGFEVEHESTAGASAEIILPVGKDTLWAGTRARGFLRLRASAGPEGWRAPQVESFGEAEGLPPTRGYTAPFLAPWGLGFFTTEGAWRFDEARRRFEPDPAFQFPGGTRFPYPNVADGAGRLWASGGRLDRSEGRPLGWYEVAGDRPRGPAAWHAAPPALQPLAGGTGFLFFHHDPRSPGGAVIWGKSPQGVVRLDPARLAALPARPWRPRVQAVAAAGAAQVLAPAGVPRYPASGERTVFRLAPGRLDAGAVTYRTRLLGLAAGWSAPAAYPEISFTNLEGGPFTLEVVARDGAGRESEPARFTFSVAPPWHRSGPARLLYGLAAVGLGAGLVRWRLGRAVRERRQLEALVAARTAELAAARDQAEAASRAKSAFLAAMSHELRTPLNGVLGYAQVLRADPRLAPDQLERLRVVQTSGEHLLRMINDVLDLAKIEAGKLEVRAGPLALGDLVQEIAAAHTPAAAVKRLGFTVEVAPDVPAWVTGDAQKLRQILDNLVGNAIKFTARGRVELRVAALSGAAGGGTQISFVVRDTGPGITAEDQARLFQPFEQARQARPEAPGAGLGLAISRALVERLGGTLALTSAPGRGSTFSFAVALPAAVPVAPGRPALAVVGYDGPRRHILIVDDHQVNRDLLVDLLQPLGFACAIEAGGEAALARLGAPGAIWPDLAIVDVRMPGLDGLELTRRLRALPRGADLKVLLTSASVLTFDPTEGRRAGCDGFLAKPFRTEDLIVQLGSLLGLQWREAAAEAASPAGPGPARGPWPEAARAVLRETLAQGDLDEFRRHLARARAEFPGEAARWDELDAAAAAFELPRLRHLLEQP